MSGLFDDLETAFRLADPPATIRMAAVVLAAGSSRRMGDRHKLLLDVGGEPMIRRTVGNVLAFGPTETIVVTGHRADEVEVAVAGLPITIVRNPNHTEGQPTSVVAGVRALTRACDAVMIVLGDQPQVTAADFAALSDAYRNLTDSGILVPHHNGARGNPVVFAARYIPSVISGSVNVGCRRLIETHGDDVAKVEMASDAFVRDCDTPEDYAALLAGHAGVGR